MASENDENTQQAISNNNDIINQLAQVAPMSINPYTAVFATAICSKTGFSNSYVATNPFFNNWFILVLFGVLFLYTLIVKPTMASNKLTGVLVTVDNYLENKAAILINAIIILLPTVVGESSADNQVVFHAGFFSITFKALLVLVISTYFLFVVMTIKLFIDFLIFLSPVPLVDSFLQVFKIVLSIGLVVISILSPILSLIIAVSMFLVSFLFLRRALNLVNRVKYLIIYPVLNTFKKKDKILLDKELFSIKVFTKIKISKKIKNGSILSLEKREDKIFIIKSGFLSKETIEVDLDNCSIYQNHLNSKICNESKTVEFLLNRTYHKYIDEVAEHLGIDIAKRAKIEINLKLGWLARIKEMFSKQDLELIKADAE